MEGSSYHIAQGAQAELDVPGRRRGTHQANSPGLPFEVPEAAADLETVVGEDGARYDMPVLANLFGTVERVAWGMEREPAELRAIGETQVRGQSAPATVYEVAGVEALSIGADGERARAG